MIDFGNFGLRKKVPFEIVFINASGTADDVSANVEFCKPDVSIILNSWSNLATSELIQQNTQLKDYHFNFSDELSYTMQLDVLENTTVTLIYSVGNNPPIEVSIPILDNPLTYEISY